MVRVLLKAPYFIYIFVTFRTFFPNETYADASGGPITDDPILKLDAKTGRVVGKFGAGK